MSNLPKTTKCPNCGNTEAIQVVSNITCKKCNYKGGVKPKKK